MVVLLTHSSGVLVAIVGSLYFHKVQAPYYSSDSPAQFEIEGSGSV